MKHIEIINKQTGNPIPLAVYSGFDNQDRILSQIRRNSSLQNDSISLIIFLNEVYAVAVDGMDRAVILGKEQVWYFKNHILNQSTWRHYQDPYKMYPILRKSSSKNQVALDLRSLDPNLRVFAWKKPAFEDITGQSYVDTYLNLLGQTFYDVFFDRDQYRKELTAYFDTYNLGSYFKTGVAGINPFQNKLLMTNGNVYKARFY